MKTYCPNCKEKINYSIRKNIIKKYKGCNVNIEENIAVCDNCKTDIFIPEIEEDNFNRLYDKYREVAHIITVDDIVNLRNKYNLSQREMTKILEWGKTTLGRYESGSVPSISHSDLLKAYSKSDETFKDKVKSVYDRGKITDKTYLKVFK